MRPPDSSHWVPGRDVWRPAEPVDTQVAAHHDLPRLIPPMTECLLMRYCLLGAAHQGRGRSSHIPLGPGKRSNVTFPCSSRRLTGSLPRSRLLPAWTQANGRSRWRLPSDTIQLVPPRSLGRLPIPDRQQHITVRQNMPPRRLRRLARGPQRRRPGRPEPPGQADRPGRAPEPVAMRSDRLSGSPGGSTAIRTAPGRISTLLVAPNRSAPSARQQIAASGPVGKATSIAAMASSSPSVTRSTPARKRWPVIPIRA